MPLSLEQVRYNFYPRLARSASEKTARYVIASMPPVIWNLIQDAFADEEISSTGRRLSLPPSI